MLKAENSKLNAETAQDEDVDMEAARDAYPTDDPIASSSSSRVTNRMQSSIPALAGSHSATQVVDIDDDSFDLTPSQEIAMNEAAILQLDRDLARSRSPNKRLSPAKLQRMAVVNNPRTPVSRAPATRSQSAVIDLVDSEDELPQISSQNAMLTPLTSTPFVNTRKRVNKERPVKGGISDIIDLSD